MTENRARSDALRGVTACPTLGRTVPCCALLFVCGLVPVRAQNPALPSPSQAQKLLQQAQQNPELADQLRQRLQQSGLTPEQIRARLQASGYPSNLLDAYLGPGGAAPTATPSANELSAIQALGLPSIALPSDTLAIDTGMIRMRVTSGRRSPVFGVDAFRRTTTQFLPTLAGPVPPDYKLGP